MVRSDRTEEIVVIDDDLMSLKLTKRIIEKAGMKGVYLTSGVEALAYFKDAPCPDIILLDVYMPEVNGFSVLKQLKEDPSYRQVPVVFLTGDEDVKTETAGLHAGVADFIRKPFAAEILLKRIRNIIELNRLHNDMASEIRAKTEKLSRAYIQIVEALAASVDAKDRYTHGHSSRVAAYSREIARRAGFNQAQQDTIFMMGLLHDVGKIGVEKTIDLLAGLLKDVKEK